jgi:hypothetical protein
LLTLSRSYKLFLTITSVNLQPIKNQLEKMRLKLSVPSVIKSLETALKAETAKKAEIQKELDKAIKQEENLLATIKKNFDSYKIEKIYTYRTCLELRLVGDFSKITINEDKSSIQRSLDQQERVIADLEKNIRLLNMCTDEYVQSSVLTDIIFYL